MVDGHIKVFSSKFEKPIKITESHPSILDWYENSTPYEFVSKEDETSIYNKALDINTWSGNFKQELAKSIDVTDIAEIKETCIQTGMPCGMTCFSKDTCKKSLFVYFKEPSEEPKQPYIFSNPDKPFIVANVRNILKEFYDQEDPISFSKMVEKFNDIAFEFYKKTIKKT